MLDPRPRLDEAAQIAARYGNTGWLISETVTAGLTHGRQLWFGNPRNVGVRLRESCLRASDVESSDDVERELGVNDRLGAGVFEAEDVARVGVVDVGA